MNTCPSIVKKLQIIHQFNGEISDEWLNGFAEITDGLENPTVDDLSRAIAATYFQCGMEPEWNACAMVIPEGMTTLVHSYQRFVRETEGAQA